MSPVFFISLKNYYIFHVCKSEYTCMCVDVRWKSGGFSFLLPPCWFQGSIRSASSEAYPSPTEPSRCPFFTFINQSIKVCLFSTDNIVSSKFWLNLESSVKYTFSVSYCSLSRKSYLKGFGNRYKKVIAIGDISVLFFYKFYRCCYYLRLLHTLGVRKQTLIKEFMDSKLMMVIFFILGL